MRKTNQANSTAKPPADVDWSELTARDVINTLYIDDKVKDYIVDIVCATRDPDAYKIGVKGFIQMGASPRATVSLPAHGGW